MNFVLKENPEKEKKCHLFVCKDNPSIAVQNSLEGERSHRDVLEVNLVPLNH